MTAEVRFGLGFLYFFLHWSSSSVLSKMRVLIRFVQFGFGSIPVSSICINT